MTLKLSTPKSRAELIAAYSYSTALAVPPPPPKGAVPPAAAAPPKAPPEAAPAGDSKPYEPAPYHADPDELVVCPKCSKHNDDDASYCDQCGFELTSTGFRPRTYSADPDETVTCPKCGKQDDTDASYCDQCGFKLAGADGVEVKAPEAATDDSKPADPAKPAEPAAPAPAKPAPPLTAALPPAIPPKPAGTPAVTAPVVDPVNPDTGDIDPQVPCANPDCGHLASAHLNDDQNGQNTGACQMTNCACLGMQVAAAPNTGTGDGGGQNVGAEPAAESQELAASPAVPDGPPPPGIGAPKTDAPGQTLNAPPPVEGSENMGPAFTIPVLIIEGQPTGDGRQIAPGALTWRTPPLPLMGLATETHDPEGFDMNDPAVICGRIDTLERQPGEGDTQIIVAHGFFLANDDGMYFSGLVEQMGRVGVSGDVAATETEVSAEGMDDDGWPIDLTSTITEGTIMAATVCPMAAFEGAYIILGDGTTDPAPAPIPQKEPITAAGIHWMSYAECEACEQGLEVITAAGGPVAPPREWFENPNFTEGDGRLSEILDRRGQRTIGGKYACPLTVTDEGRVFGHLAPWDVCHIGKPGCVTAPHSRTDYAYFKRGQHVICADGSKVRVGILTVDAPHAGLRADASNAMAHYDNVATAVADVAAGEDEFGIWIAGAIRPTASQEQVQALRASSISGDWRGLGGSLELVAALAVPVPGFPHAVVAGAQEEVLVASGAQVMHRLKHPVEAEPVDDAALMRMARPGLLKLARESARDRIAALRP